MTKERLDTKIISEIITGSCRDPFAVLGIQQTDKSHLKTIRTFLPGAVSVTAVTPSGKTKIAKLDRIDESGLFEAEISRKTKVKYKLKVQYPLATVLIDDPYQFSPQISGTDMYLFTRGEQEQCHNILGANHLTVDGINGILFSVWAPNARRVAVVGDFNHWDGRVHGMRFHPSSGIWEIFIPTDLAHAHYKFEIHSADGTLLPLKADPYAQQMQLRPGTASVVKSAKNYNWHDDKWMAGRKEKQHHQSAISIYEVHLGSWRRPNDEGKEFLSYKDLAEQLIAYVKKMNFSHIQLMPITEFPFDGSWGYQPIGMFAPTNRFGTPDEFRFFINKAHEENIGVLLDWVPGHFPTDEHGIGQFDGTFLYEHSDPKKGFHPDWNTLIYNYGRSEVASYLISNALFWLSEFHIDGLRFDAVASMLYLDYSRKTGEWIPNQFGGRENLEAIELLKQINIRAYNRFPDIMMVAEESTAWPGVTKPTYLDGLGFGFKWNLGWMNDTLSYMSRDPIHRKYHYNEISFGLLYAFSENFILPLSHDEVVHGKRSILERMPGDDWQKFANLRAYYGFMWSHPGKKLLFMGGEFAQRTEWDHDSSLDWHLLENAPHQGIQNLVRDLNTFYRETTGLYSLDCDSNGFEWLEAFHPSGAVFIFIRRDSEGKSLVITAVNLTPTVYENFTVGVPKPGIYKEAINTNSEYYGGTGQGNLGAVNAENIASHGKEWSVNITLPPLSTVVFLNRNI
ncbi:MAG: 1,4-alpha-glucan branching protein GlgB [Cellvibrionaceae bacterium]